jgi:hypothetical protein
MSNLEQIQQSNFNKWDAESLRMTAFLSPLAQIGDQNWWQTLVDELPQNEISQPKTGMKQYEGIFRGDNGTEGVLVLTVRPTRIDWQLVPLTSGVAGFPTIGSFISSTNSFLTLMLRWLEDSPQTQRLAFGASLLQLVDERDEAYKQLSKYLPFDLDLDSSDFSYQINRPRKSRLTEFPNLTTNRLSIWGVNSIFKIELPSNSFTQNYLTEKSQVALSLNLDINTVGDFTNNPTSEQLKKTFQELVQQGKEIAEKGDIK